MAVTPYLFLDGRCEEAIEFYKKTLGAKVEMLMRFSDSPGAAVRAVIHGLRSDGRPEQDHAFVVPHR